MMSRYRVLSIFVWMLPCLVAAQQRGDLLVATEQITEQAFAETVILLLHYADDGAVGVAINRPTWVTTTELFPELEDTHAYRGPVFHGGPLAQATVLALSGDARLAEGDREPVVTGVYMSSNTGLFETLVEETNDAARLRFYAGHASWGPDQLDEEVAAGAWRMMPASAALIFDPDPGSLWDRLAVSDTGMIVRLGAPASRQEAYANAE